jgi:cellulose synthase/poly-beta-1,6-N-acetylglucosamine synthase-like glycosyltransferase
MAVSFWVCVLLIVFPYTVYPGFLYILGKVKRFGQTNGESTLDPPMVSLVIAAYNEDKVIADKLRNSLELDYPRLEILVVSDGSTDRTNEIVRQFAEHGVRLLALPENRGKTVAQNLAVKECHGEIIVFSDANSMYGREAIRELVKHFANDEVGCVCGELRYQSVNRGEAAAHEGIYWRFERFIKYMEGRIGRLLGANGSIYAVRKSCYVQLPSDIISDFIEPLLILQQGKRVVYEPRAQATELTSTSIGVEFRRKKRIITRSLRGAVFARTLFHPLRHPLTTFMFLGHKALRWLAPIFIIAAFALNLLLASRGGVYTILLGLQVLFYVLACVGLMVPKVKHRALTLPTYFCVVHGAVLLGLLHALTGNKVVTWHPSR